MASVQAAQAALVAAAASSGAAVGVGGLELWTQWAWNVTPPGVAGGGQSPLPYSNPDTVYHTAWLPGAGAFAGARVYPWALGPTQVAVLLLCAPPPARYWSLTPYAWDVAYGGSQRAVSAALGDSLSCGTGGGAAGASTYTRLNSTAGWAPPAGAVQDAPSALPFGSPLAVLVGASPAAVAAVAALVVSATGLPTTALNVLPLAHSVYANATARAGRLVVAGVGEGSVVLTPFP